MIKQYVLSIFLSFAVLTTFTTATTLPIQAQQEIAA
jgi:hypothetical protein